MDTSFNCKSCESPDNDDMVQCDLCDQWYHHVCVGVNESISNKPWSCESCSAIQVDDTRGAAGGNKVPPPKNYELKEKQTSVGFSDILGQNALIVTQETRNTVSHNGTIRKGTTTKSSTQPLQFEGVTNINATVNTCASKNGAIEDVRFTANSADKVQPYSNMFSQQCVSATSETVQQQIANRRLQLQLDMLEEENKLKQQYLQKKYEILNDGQFSSTPLNNTTSFTPQGPTAAQIAARQVLPKELPKFEGDPDEWPVFISCFENSTNVGGFSNTENLIRLQTSLKGRARDLVRSKLLLPDMVPEIIETLKMYFGRADLIIERMIDKARHMPPPKDKLESLIDFALNVKNICATMEACNATSHLNNPMLVKEFIDKLPNQHKLSWAMHPKTGRPIVVEFSNWIYKLAEAASQVVTPCSSKKNASVNIHAEGHAQNTCVMCKEAHKIAKCQRFANLSIDDKWKIVKDNNLCRTCLNTHRRKCFLSKECGKDNCKAKHHPLLHKTTTPPKPKVDEVRESEITNVHTHDSGNNTLFRIVPIKIAYGNKFIETYAFLDEGSSATLIEERVFSMLGVKGESSPLCLRWTGDTIRQEEASKTASILITGRSNNAKYTLRNVHTVKNLELPQQSINMEHLVQLYPHLKGLPIKSYTDVKPTILIGSDNWSLAVPLRIREGKLHQPIASKTRLGWTIQGSAGGQRELEVLNIHVCSCEEKYNELHESVKKFFEIEASNASISSANDVRAMQILDSTIEYVDGRYVVGLPWRSEEQLTDSYYTACKRLCCLQKKLTKNPELRRKMQSEIDNLLEKNYAREINGKERTITDRVWYLPTFVTVNPNKPNRVRLVWDAAAKSDKRSLNDYLLTGPDLLTPLIDVLLSFRVGKVAISGDIAEMFHQIKVRPEDMHAQRFLWQNEGEDEPQIYVMTSLTFGMNCAPFIAHYVRNINAEKFQNKYPRAVEAIKFHHYVDDFIDSTDSAEEALKLANDVKAVHSDAGFYIRNWASNDTEVAQQLNSQDCKYQNSLRLSSTEKILGMFWEPSSDNFKYECKYARLKRDIVNDDIVPTKREVLQALMSIFDPLGFLSRHTIGLKILLQEIWRSGIDWDDQLTDELYFKWLKWKETVKQIPQFKVPRRYSSIWINAENIQLHTFVDAGEDAYAAVSYLRVQRAKEVTVSLVAAKAKVAPLKPVSIPRLELQAAVTGVRLADKIRKNEKLSIMSCYWWSDSKTVLSWLRMDPKKFQQYVMHRVGEILESSNVTQWRWVPSKMNPADLATKTLSHVPSDNWVNGPNFLYREMDEWPTCDNLTQPEVTELRHHMTHLYTPKTKEVKLNIEYFSDWKKLRRAVANFILFYEKLKKRINAETEERSIHERTKKAEEILYREAQTSTYSQEISDLRCNKLIKRTSKLISLNVYLDDEGIIRVHGRAEYLTNLGDAIVLPKNHHVTFLIVRFHHEKNHHLLHEASINEINKKFFIPQLRVVYKKMRKNCQRCKNTSANPVEQQMAPLPKARLAAFERPFSYVGIDYFGPILVTLGRRQEKRWGVIFTCLTLRAIHIEIAHSLDTNSCMMCLQNFMARRGTPIQIYTDNGTNFRATAKLLRELIKDIDYEIIANKSAEIEWKFNPPAAPHMGGAWERLIRTIKSVLHQIQPKTSWNDETLRNAMLEVEFIINSRPLTFVSLQKEDDEALTPNHLLLGSSNGSKPAVQHPNDIRQRWHQSQLFADNFWRRWLCEYTPTLTRRNKWYQKQPPIQRGDVVVVVDETLPRNCWPKGIIEQAVLSKDGQVRRAVIRTQYGTIQRPTIKLARLDVGKSQQ